MTPDSSAQLTGRNIGAWQPVLAAALSSSEFLSKRLQRCWVHADSILVVDFQIGSRIIAFDLSYPVPDRWLLEAFDRSWSLKIGSDIDFSDGRKFPALEGRPGHEPSVQGLLESMASFLDRVESQGLGVARAAKFFVSVAAYCEPHLEFTLDGLFAKAFNPQSIVVGLVDQSFGENRSWLSKKPWWPQVRYVQIHPMDCRGVSWARSMAFSLYQDEEYLLQVDSHTMFEDHWDLKLIRSMGELKKLAEKPVLTTYPPAFEFNAEGQAFRVHPPTEMIAALAVLKSSELSETSASLGFNIRWVQGTGYLEGFHIAAGFLCAPGKFVEEVPYDPYMYFQGEEQNLAIRAYTRGWTIFHPRHDNVPLCHLYKQSGHNHPSVHWNEEHEAQRKVRWYELQQRSDARLRGLLFEAKQADPFGLGSARSLEDFAKLSGIDYSQRKITRPD